MILYLYRCRLKEKKVEFIHTLCRIYNRVTSISYLNYKLINLILYIGKLICRIKFR